MHGGMDHSHWREALPLDHPCHYQNRWLDSYADRVRKAAFARLWARLPAWPHGGYRREVLDIGCGDGRFGQWVRDKFGARVTGVDPFEYKGVHDRLNRFRLGTGEDLGLGTHASRFDVALMVTSLLCVNSRAVALAQARTAASRLIVIDNTQTPVPPWQLGHGYKNPFTFEELLADTKEAGWNLDAAETVNLIDRRLFFCLPGPLAMALTVPLDLALARIVPPRRARYTATLFG